MRSARPDDGMFTLLPGADLNEFVVDNELGLLLRCTAFVGGRIAMDEEVTALHVEHGE
jgi:hypothetical protein